ncbi:MAG: nicotinamide mononucleotide transporter [Alphaproteobacteria bacterium]|nr:nicotinamide mononucleotide transporter [Alphaproteobacteria bacterium]MBL6937099.1 nicotinamide mononucleotide transporter [Alphaproteobacteria bacterium]MBL7096339.1 nicotinamide mononucleotide transporter [Alphaproteobacteria bacterium]
MSVTEIIAALLGVANIALLVRRSIWNYPFGMASVAFYVVVFHDSLLYSDAALQVFFFVMQVYGWWNWYHARDTEGLAKPELLTNGGRLLWMGAALAITVAEGWYLKHYTNDSAPWMDANTTALSVVAQYLLSVRKIENWALWIITDVVQIGLYAWKGLYPTTALYVIYLVMSVLGLIEWRRHLVAATPREATA